MTEEKKEYNHNEIVEWLKERHPHDDTHTPYTSFEDIPKKEVAKGVLEAEVREKILQGKLPIDLRYAVDFIYVEKKVEKEEEEIDKKEAKEPQEFSYYTLFFIYTTNISDEKSGKILDSIRKMLLFYQFYFSSIAEPKSLKIIVVVPHYINIPSETIEKFFKDYKFGLWKIDINKDKEEEIVAAKYLRDRMCEEFKVSVDDPNDMGEAIEKISNKIKIDIPSFKIAIKERAEDFAIFFENYILDAVDAISGIKPEQIGKRYIDRKLMDLVFKLKEVSYGDNFPKLINEHLDKKEDDYLFSRNCFNFLWKSNFNGMEYPRTLERFEIFLQDFFPEYREHFVHQFQVFLLGVIILDSLLQNPINELFEDGEMDVKKDNLVKGWLLASSIHDFTYPLQQYDEWSSEFFKEQLKIDEPLSFLELKGIYVEKTFLTRVEHLLSMLGESFVHSLEREDKTRLYNEIRRFFYYEIAEKKNHGLMSSSYLLKKFEGKDREEFSKVILPAAIASAIHDDEIWQTLSGQANKDIEKRWGYIAELLGIEKDIVAKILKSFDINDEQKYKEIADILRDKKSDWIGNIYTDISNIIAKKPLSELYLKKQPLTFLLILCDNLQECGRICKDEERRKGMETADIRLKDIIVNDKSSTIIIQLFFNDMRQNISFMEYKERILSKIENFLKSPDIKFIIEFWDRETKVKTKYIFKIGGNN